MPKTLNLNITAPSQNSEFTLRYGNLFLFYDFKKKNQPDLRIMPAPAIRMYKLEVRALRSDLFTRDSFDHQDLFSPLPS